MLAITPEAAAYIKEKQKPIHLELPPEIGCCIHLLEKPSVRLGPPHDPHNYEKIVLQGVEAFVPKELVSLPLTITVNQFLGFRSLGIIGWKLV